MQVVCSNTITSYINPVRRKKEKEEGRKNKAISVKKTNRQIEEEDSEGRISECGFLQHPGRPCVMIHYSMFTYHSSYFALHPMK